MSNVSSISPRIQHFLRYSKISSIDNNTRRFKTGVIIINSCKMIIKSSDSIHSIANKINAVKNRTGVEAKIVQSYGRYVLILEAKDPEINITDNEKILFDLYKSGMLGICKNSLRRIVGLNNYDKLVNIRYNYTLKSQNIPAISSVNGTIKSELAKIPQENQLSETKSFTLLAKIPKEN